jgi:hypothetical protein
VRVDQEPRILRRADPKRRRHRRDAARRPRCQRQALAQPARAVRDLRTLCTGPTAMYGGGMAELGVGRGQIQLLAALFTPMSPMMWRRAATTKRPPGDLPASPMTPRPEATGFRWRRRASTATPRAARSARRAGRVTADRGSACSLKVPSRPVDWRCEDAKFLQIAISLTPSVQLSCVVPEETTGGACVQDF